MPKLTRVVKINGKPERLTDYEGLTVADIDHFRIDLIRYLQGNNPSAKVEITTNYEETHPGGGWDNEVENY